MTRAIGIIPARMASTRFPGKPLAALHGKPVLRWVWDAVDASRTLYPCYVATDSRSREIIDYCSAEKIPYIETESDCRTGTERVAQAARRLSFRDGDIVVNVQGDEPMVRPGSLDALVEAMLATDAGIASLYFKPSDAAFIADPNRVKVLVGTDGQALSFSRQASSGYLWTLYGQHVGVYAYRRELLEDLARLRQNEDLEQTAWLEAGYRMRMVEIAYETVAIDAPEDIERCKT